MMKPLPKSLQAWAQAHPDKFDEGWSEQDGFADRSGAYSHWIYLKPGWINPAHGVHLIHECTTKECLDQLKHLERCFCDDCKAEGIAPWR